MVCNKNPLMQQVTRLRPHVGKPKSDDVALTLNWDEGTEEVAALLDYDSSRPVAPRAVVFRTSPASKPQYLDPLSCLYEPLSYPLWYPHGGRGWGPDLPYTQMWWCKQQLLTLTHMGMCGRLLNEWLVNAYCRIEDERLNCIRHEQRRRMATRTQLTDALQQDGNDFFCTGKKFYLPATVVGSPGHLRRRRCDSLEMARRKGLPSYFVTATCNPEWPEIQAELLPGQTAADRPDITVRFFHARLARLIDFLKHEFQGQAVYEIKVVEYQRRGLPHVHIAIAYASRPTTAAEVDVVISCELPEEPGTLRSLVLRHMVHRCKSRCHPEGDTSFCKNGFPFTFQEETDFDRRGYPQHKRRPCGGHCPKC